MRAARLLAAIALAVGTVGCSHAAGTSRPHDTRAIENAVLRSTVRIRADLCDSLSTGSGFLTETGDILTNIHVIEGATLITITTWDGYDHHAVPTAISSEEDLVSLSAVSLERRGLIPIDPQGPASDEPIIVAGHGGAGPLSLQSGRVLGVTGTTGGSGEALRTDVPVRPGGSGGPAVSLTTGRAIGIVFAYDEDSGDGLIIPISAASTLTPHQHTTTDCR